MFIHKRRRKKLNNKSSNPYPKLVDELTTVMSIVVRKTFADEHGFVRCVCCGKVYYWRYLDAGHFIPKARGVAVRFDWFNVWPQCKSCNSPKQNGEMGKIWFYQWMSAMFGEEEIERLQQAAATSKKQNRDDLRRMIEHYNACAAELEYIT